MTERRYLEKAGKRTFLISALFTVALLAATPLLLVQGGWIFYSAISRGRVHRVHGHDCRRYDADAGADSIDSRGDFA